MLDSINLAKICNNKQGKMGDFLISCLINLNFNLFSFQYFLEIHFYCSEDCNVNQLVFLFLYRWWLLGYKESLDEYDIEKFLDDKLEIHFPKINSEEKRYLKFKTTRKMN